MPTFKLVHESTLSPFWPGPEIPSRRYEVRSEVAAFVALVSDVESAEECRQRSDEVERGEWKAVRLHSRSAARAQAHRESHMYRQGSGWIVSTWDEAVRCNRVSGELPWPIARQSLADWRTRRAAQLQGVEQ